MKKFFTASLFALFSLFLFAGCGADTANLDVRLTDSPVTLSNGETVEQINFTVTRVDVVKKGSGEANKTDTDIKDGDGVYTVLETETNLNLLEYRDGATLLLGSVNLEPGDYLQLRFIIKDGSATIKFAGDDTIYPLTIPSAADSGVKIKGNGLNPLFSVSEGDNSTLVFDLDAAESLIVDTNHNGYKLRPVIKEVKFQNTIMTSGEFEME